MAHPQDSRAETSPIPTARRRGPRAAARLAVLAVAAGIAACGEADSPDGTDRAAARPGPPAGAIESAGATGRSDPSAPPPDAPADAPLVVFLGDSLTAGFGVAGDDAFPAVVARRFAEAGSPIRTVNAGVSGDTTAGGLRRVDWLLRQEPDVVVIALGANDGLRGLDLDEAQANLERIVERVRDAGATPLLCGVRIPTNYGPDYTERFAAMYPEVAEATGAPFLPFLLEGVGGIDAMNLADGIHPNPEGHRRMAATVRAALEPLVAVAREEGEGGGDDEG